MKAVIQKYTLLWVFLSRESSGVQMLLLLLARLLSLPNAGSARSQCGHVSKPRGNHSVPRVLYHRWRNRARLKLGRESSVIDNTQTPVGFYVANPSTATCGPVFGSLSYQTTHPMWNRKAPFPLCLISLCVTANYSRKVNPKLQQWSCL